MKISFSLLWRLLDRAAPYIPASWRLPLRYWAWRCSSEVEPELVHLFRLCPNFRCAVDVGCNHGFYAYRMLQRFERVYAFEANPGVDFDILHFKNPRLQLAQFGLSNRQTTSFLNIPVVQGVAYEGWASLADRQWRFADSAKKIPVRLERLDDQAFTRAESIDLIKLDVEGHELEVLQGAVETIGRHKPVLIVESNDNFGQVVAFLGALGYRLTDLSTLEGKPLPSPNRIFLPQ